LKDDIDFSKDPKWSAVLVRVLESIDANTSHLGKMASAIANDNTEQQKELAKELVESLKKRKLDDQSKIKPIVDQVINTAKGFDFPKTLSEDCDKSKPGALEVLNNIGTNFKISSGKFYAFVGDRGFGA
jgi:Asp-tRNA(Asn)/Glu-tRNA(Gln) amidotransferase B subunit